MEIVQTNGSEFDQWGIAKQIWMIMYELNLRDIEVCSYIKIIFKLLKKLEKLRNIFFCNFKQSKQSLI